MVYTGLMMFTRVGPSPHGEGGLKCCQCHECVGGVVSLPAWGGWIEMGSSGRLHTCSRSLPAWGGWIEIAVCCMRRRFLAGPSPHGEGGLKSGGAAAPQHECRPSPHGEGGLKLM